MPWQQRALAPPVQQSVHRHQAMAIVDAHAVGGRLHLQDALDGAIGHAVEVATDRDHALMADAPLGAQHGVEAPGTYFGINSEWVYKPINSTVKRRVITLNTEWINKRAEISPNY